MISPSLPESETSILMKFYQKQRFTPVSYTHLYAYDQAAIILAGNNAEGNFHISYYEGKFNAY